MYSVGDVAPNHAPCPHSILSLTYKRLLPDELSRLNAGDEIIIVIPPSNDVNSSVVSAATSSIHRVMLLTCPRLPPVEQQQQLELLMRSHEFKRRGSMAHEFCVRVMNFPEKQQLDREFANDKYPLSLMSQGAGYYVEVCGYSSSACLLVKLSWLPYIEMYKLAPCDDFTNEEIYFPRSINSPEKLAKSLAENLLLVDGCPISTMETLWKYSRQDANLHRRLLEAIKRAHLAQSTAAESSNPPSRASSSTAELKDVLISELDVSALKKFSSMVDKVYEDAFKHHYSSFTPTPDSLLYPSRFVDLYEESPHEPSKLASLFSKQDGCYQRQSGAMRKCDSWLAEKEACELVTVWKACGKTSYFRQQCEYIEDYYNSSFPFEEREFMRRNGFCVLSDRERGVAFDEAYELYNADIKETKLSTDLSVNVDRSRHVMLSRGCAEIVFDRKQRNKNAKSSREDDVVCLERFLFKCNLFQGHGPEKMHDNYFWDNVEVPKNVGTAKDKCKETVPLSEFEIKLKDNLCLRSEMANTMDDSFAVTYDDDD
jgi:hypothetical protein